MFYAYKFSRYQVRCAFTGILVLCQRLASVAQQAECPLQDGEVQGLIQCHDISVIKNGTCCSPLDTHINREG